MAPGSMVSPNAKKKAAANASLSLDPPIGWGEVGRVVR